MGLVERERRHFGEFAVQDSLTSSWYTTHWGLLTTWRGFELFKIQGVLGTDMVSSVQ
jgi:hypothetical protein